MIESTITNWKMYNSWIPYINYVNHLLNNFCIKPKKSIFKNL